MKKTLLATLLLTSICAAPLATNAVYAAPNVKEDMPVTEITANDEASPYLLTKMEVGTRADSEYVYAVAKNTFTLFISTVPVTVYLYSSPTFTTDITQMTLEAKASTGDLDVYKEITCKARNTEQKYWVAHCVYTSDNQTKRVTSTPILYSTDGKVLN